MSQYIEVTPDLLAGFLDEAPEYLTTLEDGLMTFEEQAGGGTIVLRTDADHERMTSVFRAAHSFKGIAATLGFDKIRELTHVMESLFDQLRTGKRELQTSDVQALFGTVDVLRQLIDELSEPTDPPVAIEEPMATLNRIMSDASSPATASSKTTVAATRAPEVDSITSDTELLTLFVESTSETLDLLSQQLLALEEHPTEPEVINEVFRSAHNIKGASGAVGCRTMNRLTHDMETVLDRVRANEIVVDGSMISAMFEAVDRLRISLDYIKDGRSQDIAKLMAPDFFAAWAIAKTPPAAESEAAAPSTPVFSGDSLIVRVTFRKDDHEAPILACLIHNRLADRASLIHAEPDVFSLADATDVGEIAYQLATDLTPPELEEIVNSYAIESVRIECPEPPASAEPAPVGAAPQMPATAASPSKKDAPTGAKVGETIRVDLERLDQLMNLGGELVITKARFTDIVRKLAMVFSSGDLNYLVDDMANRLKGMRKTAAGLAASRHPVQDAAELSETALHLTHDFENVRGLIGRVHDSRPVMGEFGEAVHSLTRISEGIQRRIMQTRMVAIGPLFQRFRRSVRDMCRATGKSVELCLHGEATELDKRMVDELVDPLTHMVRNSVDHGIETPEERRKAGKPETGKLELDAFHRGRHICIQVRDDGKGLDLEKIRQKIVERELATDAQVEQMGDHEVMQYVFRSGFSTAEKVTDLSGRGMGMDIVRSKLEMLKGEVELDSTPGVGTTFTISLPLTLAIVPAMIARIGTYTYAVPLEAVVEITTVSRKSVKHVQRQAMLCLRNEVIPLAVLENILRVNNEGQRTRSLDESDSLTVMILSFQKERLGLIVDELIGQDDVVIKDVATNFQNVEGVAGASIMGDGSVSLILDVGTLMQKFAQGGAQELVFRDREVACAAGGGVDDAEAVACAVDGGVDDAD